MSLTREAIANIRYRLEQMQREIDTDPDLQCLKITVTVNERSRRVRKVYVGVERAFDAAPAGVAVAAHLNGIVDTA